METIALIGLFFAFLAIGTLFVRMQTIFATWEPTEVTKAVRAHYTERARKSCQNMEG